MDAGSSFRLILLLFALYFFCAATCRRSTADHFQSHSELLRAARVGAGTTRSGPSTVPSEDDDDGAQELVWAEQLERYDDLVREAVQGWKTATNGAVKILKASGLLVRATSLLPRCCLLPTLNSTSRGRYAACMRILRRGVLEAQRLWQATDDPNHCGYVTGDGKSRKRRRQAEKMVDFVVTAERCASLGIWDSVLVGIVQRQTSASPAEPPKYDEDESELRDVDFYTMLGVALDGTHAAVKRAYLRARAAAKNEITTDEGALEALQEAFEVLYDPWRRLKYDEHRDAQRESKNSLTKASNWGSPFSSVDLWLAARASALMHRWLWDRVMCNESDEAAEEEAVRVLQRYLHYEFLIGSPESASRALAHYLKLMSSFFVPSRNEGIVEPENRAVHPSWLARQLLRAESAWSPFEGFWVEGPPCIFDISSVTPLKDHLRFLTTRRMAVDIHGGHKRCKYSQKQLAALRSVFVDKSEPPIHQIHKILQHNDRISEREAALMQLIGAASRDEIIVLRSTRLALLCTLHHLTELYWSDSSLSVLGIASSTLAADTRNDEDISANSDCSSAVPLNVSLWEDVISWGSLFGAANQMLSSMRCKLSSELPVLAVPGKAKGLFPRSFEPFLSLVSSFTNSKIRDKGGEFHGVKSNAQFIELNVALMLGHIFQKRATSIMLGAHGDAVRREYEVFHSMDVHELVAVVAERIERKGLNSDDRALSFEEAATPFARRHRRAANRCFANRGFSEATINPTVFRRLKLGGSKFTASAKQRTPPLIELEVLLRGQHESTQLYQLYRFYSILLYSIAVKRINFTMSEELEGVCDFATLFCVDEQTNSNAATKNFGSCCEKTVSLVKRKIKSFMHLEGIVPGSDEEAEWMPKLLNIADVTCAFSTTIQQK